MSRKRPQYPQTCAVHAPGDISCAGAPCPGFIYAAPSSSEEPPELGVRGPDSPAELAQERVNLGQLAALVAQDWAWLFRAA